ncbi:MAG: NmrA family NAD(P)-binding protein [Acidobacteriota bacterium]
MYVVLGASGKTGGCAADALLDMGESVRVVVRNPEKGAAWKTRGADVAVADVDDASALAHVLRGADGAYIIVPRNFAVSDVLESRDRCIESLARAVDESGLTNVVFMSSVGAHHAAGTGLIRSLHYAEQRFADVRADVVFLRGSYFLENWEMDLAALRQGDVFNTFLRADLKIPQVAVRDLGNVIAELLTRPRRGHQVVEFTGPADWSPAEIAQAMGEVAGKSVRVQQWPASAAAEALVQVGVPRPVAVLIQEMYEGLDSGHVALESPQTVRRGQISARSAMARMWRAAGTGV